MHTRYTDKGGRGGGSLKNTKINYTKDLLRHCLLNIWEDFAILCVLQVSVQAKSVVLLGEQKQKKKKGKISLSLFCPRRHVDAQSSARGQKHSDGRLGSWRSKFSLEQPKREERSMSLFSEDKCFNCYHTDFYSRLSECSRSRLQHCTSFYVVSLYSPPGFTK